MNGQKWQQVDHKDNNTELNGKRPTRPFVVTGGGECWFIRLVNIGKNLCGGD
jgi:hypothetical protein